MFYLFVLSRNQRCFQANGALFCPVLDVLLEQETFGDFLEYWQTTAEKKVAREKIKLICKRFLWLRNASVNSNCAHAPPPG